MARVPRLTAAGAEAMLLKAGFVSLRSEGSHRILDIYELGLIYDVKVDEAGQAHVKMTLTAPNCPVAGTLPAEVEAKVRAVPGLTAVKLDLVFDPPWNKDRMSPAAKLALGLEDIMPIKRIRR